MKKSLKATFITCASSSCAAASPSNKLHLPSQELLTAPNGVGSARRRLAESHAVVEHLTHSVPHRQLLACRYLLFFTPPLPLCDNDVKIRQQKGERQFTTP